MATAKLTERTIERLDCPAGRRDRMVFDGEQRGLAVRVMAGGSKAYLAQYTYQGKRHRIPLGSTDRISLASARDAVRVIQGQVAQGGHPAADRKTAAAAARAEATRERLTVGTLIGDWERIHLSKQSESYRIEAPRMLRKALEAWLDRPAEQLSRVDVIAVLDPLFKSIKRSVAAYGSAAFGWAAKREVVKSNPFSGVATLATTQRERALSDAEVVCVWTAALDASPPYGRIVRFLLLTAQRRDEVAGLPWSELSEDLRIWTLPAHRAKNKVQSVIPLGPAAVAMLGTPPRNRRGLVFPCRGGKQFGNWSRGKTALDKASGVRDWTIHDLRRTAATGFQRLKVRLEVTEAILNHVSGTRSGVAGIYQRYDWLREKGAALRKWERFVAGLLEPPNKSGRAALPRVPKQTRIVTRMPA